MLGVPAAGKLGIANRDGDGEDTNGNCQVVNGRCVGEEDRCSNV